MTVYREIVQTPIGQLSLVSTDEGLSFIGLDDASGRDADRFITAAFPTAEIETGGKHNRDAAEQLGAYFDGNLTNFTVKIDLHRDGFTRKALQEVQAIPYGKTRTYGEIASALGNPRSARAVGAANRSNPIPIIIPCHRVVAADGLGGYGGGLELKRRLLRMEGAIPERASIPSRR